MDGDVVKSSNNIEWIPITLTFVEYPKDDYLGKLLAFTSLSPIFITAGFIALIVFRRDLHTITFFIGIFTNEVVNQFLKLWIKEPRPTLRTYQYTEFGMPSSHSQFIWFFTIYVTFFILIRLHHTENTASLQRVFRILLLLLCWTLSALVCISRSYLLYHTWSQIIVGSLIGIVFGVSWFFLTHITLTPLFPYIVSWRISEIFLLRDTTLIPNILWFEYTVTRQESRARSRKLVSMKSQ